MTINSKITLNTLKKIEKITGSKLTFGALLWAIRQSDEISQIDFANKIGVSKQHLCDVERGRKLISPKSAAKYAEILGYSTEQFIRLSLQDLIDRDGLDVQVEIVSTKHKKQDKLRKAA